MLEDIFILTEESLRIHTTFLRTSRELKGSVLFVHGLADHSGRYHHIAEYLAQRGFESMLFDFRGNGRSDGIRGYIDSFDDFLGDMECAVRHFLDNTEEAPKFLFAHSLGALIAATYLLDRPNPFDGVVYSGGLFKVNEDLSPILQKLSGIVSRVAPKMPTVKLDLRLISRVPKVIVDAKSDPLKYNGGVRARTGAVIINATSRLQSQLNKINYPILIIHGGADAITKAEASELLFKESTSDNKTLEIIPDAYHETFNDHCRDQVFETIHQWFSNQLRKSEL